MRIAAPLLCAVLAFAGVSARSGAAEPAGGKPVSIAVFRFELVDRTPAATFLGKSADQEESPRKALRQATQAAREELAKSGRYRIVSTRGAHARAVQNHTLRKCGGCEATIARKLGAQESMLGIVRLVRQTDYYIAVVIRNAHTGKIVDSQVADFEGGVQGWANGAKVLIKYQVLRR